MSVVITIGGVVGSSVVGTVEVGSSKTKKRNQFDQFYQMSLSNQLTETFEFFTTITLLFYSRAVSILWNLNVFAGDLVAFDDRRRSVVSTVASFIAVETFLKLVLQINLWINFFALLEQVLVKSARPLIFIFNRWTSGGFVRSALVEWRQSWSLNGGCLKRLLSGRLFVANILWTALVLFLHRFAVALRRFVTNITIANNFLQTKRIWIILLPINLFE